MKVDKILNFLNFFIVEIFLQTEKTWIFVFTAMCCASSVSSLTQGCLRLHATFQKFWRNFCYRSIFAQSVARRLVFVIGLKFRQSIYFASNRNIFLSEKFADQKVPENPLQIMFMLQKCPNYHISICLRQTQMPKMLRFQRVRSKQKIRKIRKIHRIRKHTKSKRSNDHWRIQESHPQIQPYSWSQFFL